MALATPINGYKLDFTGPYARTTGIDLIGPDPNSYNEDGMTPLQVALQAGNSDELKYILTSLYILTGRRPNPFRRSADGQSPRDFIRIYEEVARHQAHNNRSVISAIENKAAEMRGVLQEAEERWRRPMWQKMVGVKPGRRRLRHHGRGFVPDYALGS